MKKILDWQSEEIVEIFDEVTLWSAPFGKLLLDNIPMEKGDTVVDIGFGTGFPLIELAQRFGETSKIYGVDIWPKAIEKTKRRASVLELKNIQIFEQSAAQIPLADETVDLVCSNLGINNFDDKAAVYSEVHRILKVGGKLCLSTNTKTTFKELFQLFEQAMIDLGHNTTALSNYIEARGTLDNIEAELKKFGFKHINTKSEQVIMRFLSGEALFNHSLMRIGFKSSWDTLIEKENQNVFYAKVIHLIAQIVDREGVFNLSIPVDYLALEKC